MAVRKISQKRARAAELEQERRLERSAYNRSYPGGTHIATYTLTKDFVLGKLACAQILGCPLVARINGNEIQIYALPA